MTHAAMTMKPPRSSVVAGWAIIVFGLLLSLASLAAFFPEDGETRDVGGGVMMLLFAGITAGIGSALVTARASADANGIRYRHGLIRRRVSRGDVSAVTVGPGSGMGYARLCIHVQRHHGKPLRLLALQRPSTDKARAALTVIAEELSVILVGQPH